MREIKFRAWHQDAKDIVYFGLGANHMQAYSLDDGADYTLDLEHGHPVMQYTCLKDKNGVEIYEGDIIRGNLIKYSPLETMGCVVFDEDWCSFANRNEAGNTLLREINKIEVIGNIYENQDLLK